MTRIFWIDAAPAGRLGIMARPCGGDLLRDDVAAWRATGVDLLISLLEAEEIRELALEAEAELCRAAGIDHVSFPVRDYGVPTSFRDAAALARSIAARVTEGATVAIHCRGGVGRSSVMAACVLISGGVSDDDALASIARARGVRVPETDQQRQWVARFAKTV